MRTLRMLVASVQQQHAQHATAKAVVSAATAASGGDGVEGSAGHRYNSKAAPPIWLLCANPSCTVDLFEEVRGHDPNAIFYVEPGRDKRVGGLVWVGSCVGGWLCRWESGWVGGWWGGGGGGG